MTAKIKYRVDQITLSAEMSKKFNGAEKIQVLIQEIFSDYGLVDQKVIAYFNLDSEAYTFSKYLEELEDNQEKARGK